MSAQRKIIVKDSLPSDQDEPYKALHEIEHLYTCIVCTEKFNTVGNFIVHSKVHVAEDSRRCVREERNHKDDDLKPYIVENTRGKINGCVKDDKNLDKIGNLKPDIDTYKCEECGKCFSSSSNLEKHTSSIYICNECGKIFCENHLLMLHMQVHTDEKRFKCKECSKCFHKRQELLSHVKLHTVKITKEIPVSNRHTRYTCLQCGQRFSKHKLFEAHMKEHENQKLYTCMLCSKQFNTASRLRVHAKVHANAKFYNLLEENHKYLPLKKIYGENLKTPTKKGKPKKQKEDRSSNNSGISNSQKAVATTPYMCDYCKKYFRTDQMLKSHIKIHTKENSRNLHQAYGSKPGVKTPRRRRPSKHAEDQYSDEPGDSNSYNADLKPYICNECGKCFALKDYLQKHTKLHMKIHSKRVLASGDTNESTNSSRGTSNAHECQNSTEVKSDLNSLESKHNNKYIHEVNNLLYDMISVIERYSTGVTPYMCNKCGKCFKSSSRLQRHAKTHTTQNPFKCEDCHKCFSRSDTLKLHMKHHKAEKTLKCDVCGKCFFMKYDLSCHMKTHTGEKPYKCKECGKRFSTTGALTRHGKTHGGEKIHNCEKCGSFFSRKDHLTLHMLTHSGVTPYQCKKCGRGFNQNSNLKRHMLTHIS